MALPIVNPPNPYVGNLRIFPGTLVKVSGMARPNAISFAIRFGNPRGDLPIHLSPCFTPPRIVRNSFRSGAWGLEEAWGNGQILSPHQPFEIIILTEPDQFKIAINGAHYCEFKHRIPIQEISHLTIDGDVDIGLITITSIEQPVYQPPPPISAPYPTTTPMGMPVPGMYPNIGGPASGVAAGGYPAPSGGYPAPSGGYPPVSVGQAGYPHSQPAGSYGQPPGPIGPNPTGSSYLGGYPQQHQQQPHQPGHSSLLNNLPIGGKALGTIAGLGLVGAVGAGVLSSAKKILKPPKFKHKGKGWGRSSSSSSRSSSSSSSSSSNSSRGSFSSNSS